MIHIGDKFITHGSLHGASFEGVVFRVESIRPSVRRNDDGSPVPGIRAGAIFTISATAEDNPEYYTFYEIDEETMKSISCPSFSIEVIRDRGSQLSLF